MARQSALVIGAGIAGIATAHYLALRPGIGKITIADRGRPMAFTSARSGENYRNWWPHPVMTAFTDLSISLMEEIDRASRNGIGMTRRGYALATRRSDIGVLMDALHDGYAAAARDALRLHGPGDGDQYILPISADWRAAPEGVDILTNRDLIRRTFPSYDPEVAAVIHVWRRSLAAASSSRSDCTPVGVSPDRCATGRGVRTASGARGSTRDRAVGRPRRVPQHSNQRPVAALLPLRARQRLRCRDR